MYWLEKGLISDDYLDEDVYRLIEVINKNIDSTTRILKQGIDTTGFNVLFLSLLSKTEKYAAIFRAIDNLGDYYWGPSITTDIFNAYVEGRINSKIEKNMPKNNYRFSPPIVNSENDVYYNMVKRYNAGKDLVIPENLGGFYNYLVGGNAKLDKIKDSLVNSVLTKLGELLGIEFIVDEEKELFNIRRELNSILSLDSSVHNSLGIDLKEVSDMLGLANSKEWPDFSELINDFLSQIKEKLPSLGIKLDTRVEFVGNYFDKDKDKLTSEEQEIVESLKSNLVPIAFIDKNANLYISIVNNIFVAFIEVEGKITIIGTAKVSKDNFDMMKKRTEEYAKGLVKNLNK